MSKDIYDMRENAPLEKITIEVKCKEGKLGTFLQIKTDGHYNIPKNKWIDNTPTTTFNLAPDSDKLYLTIIRKNDPNITIEMSAKLEDTVAEWTDNFPG